MYCICLENGYQLPVAVRGRSGGRRGSWVFSACHWVVSSWSEMESMMPGAWMRGMAAGD